MPTEPRVVLYGGRVLDPASGLEENLNLIIREGRIEALTREPYVPEPSDNAVDVTGCLVTPGLIDHHCHLYPLAENIGLPGEAVMFSNGVTSAVDAGSSGSANYPVRRSLRETSLLTFKAYLHVSPLGLTREELNPACFDRAALRELFARYGDELLGLKIRTSRDLVGERGYGPLRAAVELGESLGVPLMVHPTDPPGEMEELLSLLRPGDVLTHMYMNIGSTILDENGRVKDCVRKARERGVLFEAADAQAHFGFSTAIPAIEQGFYPDFIATDGTRKSMLKRPTTFSLAMQLARYEALGLPFKEVLRRLTVNPARHMGLRNVEGTLTPGGVADVAVFRRHEREVTFADRPLLTPGQAVLTGHVVYEPVVTVKAGMIVYRNILY